MTAVEQLAKYLQDLPDEKREAMAAALIKQVEAYGGVSAARTVPDYMPFPVEKRTAGLGKGAITMMPDFDDPLPDAFWLAEE